MELLVLVASFVVDLTPLLFITAILGMYISFFWNKLNMSCTS